MLQTVLRCYAQFDFFPCLLHLQPWSKISLSKLDCTSQCIRLSNLILTRRTPTATEVINFSMVTLLVLVKVRTGTQATSSHSRVFSTPPYCHVWHGSSQTAVSWSELNELVIILEMYLYWLLCSQHY